MHNSEQEDVTKIIKDLETKIGTLQQTVQSKKGVEKVKAMAELGLVKNRLVICRFWLKCQMNGFSKVKEAIEKKQAAIVKPAGIIQRIWATVASFFKRR